MLLVLLQCTISVKIPVNLLWGNSDKVVNVWHSNFIWYVVYALQQHIFILVLKTGRMLLILKVRSVHASCQGTGLAGITKVAGILDLPPPVTEKVYNNIVKTLSSKSMTARESFEWSSQ